jgi:hypothetical protein
LHGLQRTQQAAPAAVAAECACWAKQPHTLAAAVHRPIQLVQSTPIETYLLLLSYPAVTAALRQQLKSLAAAA